ncbi:YihY/virulence factor BrkB family protein [Jatrophihabitans sp.]|uniref:YihY/virulence factor BrkB family protein n=1 Tax=Jatrophihabitans sp. TaxID=1932789 RepID=UPI002C2F095A|nr:YihY/virulence factor BrkB family protein [Jatrophihabitans sp.]
MSVRRVGTILVAVLRAAVRHRVNAHASAMAFFALLSLVPATVTLGGVLHALARVGGPELAVRAQQGASEAIRLLIGPKLADPVINPFVATQLSQTSGPALTGLLASAWLISRIFYSLVHGLDVAFGVDDQRPTRSQRLYALGHAIVVVGVIAVTLAVMVLGWHSGHAGLDRVMGRSPVVAQLWIVLRWPLLFFILLGVIVNLYRYGPNVRLSVRQCLPGASMAVLLWIGAAGVFRGYLLIGAVAPTGVHTDDQQVVLIGQAIGASIATGVWLYFSSLAILTGAELNSVLLQLRASAPAAVAAEPVSPRRRTVGRPRLPRVLGVRAAAIGHWFEGRSR